MPFTSHVPIFLKSGLSTEGDSDRVRLVGPRDPMTKRRHPDQENTRPNIDNL